jgi:spermidine synthase
MDRRTGLAQSFPILNVRHAQGGSCVHLSEQNGVRSLHLGNSMVQSAMRLTVPNQLELAYTRCMMGFMLFNPRPANILMIGLGGGSLAKFVYHRLHGARATVIEINPKVVVAARNHFFVPPDDERLQVLIGEGGEYVADHPASADVLMVDGFDDCCQVASLCTPDFYDHARAALKRNGILVVNLLSRSRGFQNYLRRIDNSFSGHVATLAVDPRGNLIAFAFRQNPGRRVWEDLPERAKKLENEFGLPFTEFARNLRRRKPP